MTFQDKTLLITGGTGTFGRAFVRRIFSGEARPSSIRIYSRDEQKQFEMMGEFPPERYPVRYILGDVRDRKQLSRAMREVDLVVHAAAMKHVHFAEHNPLECVRTNILGSQNLIDAAEEAGVERVVALSTDKAVSPANAYGASKLLLEKLFLHADALSPEGRTRFSVVRYGNIFASKGSVIPLFARLAAAGEPLPVTHPEMTRFSITLRESVDLVLFALREGWGGEVIVPRPPSYRILDVVEALAPEGGYRIVGARRGEKLHELLYNVEESYRTLLRDGYCVVAPQEGRWCVEEYRKRTGSEAAPEGVPYDSGHNDHWLDVEELRRLIREETHH